MISTKTKKSNLVRDCTVELHKRGNFPEKKLIETNFYLAFDLIINVLFWSHCGS